MPDQQVRSLGSEVLGAPGDAAAAAAVYTCDFGEELSALSTHVTQRQALFASDAVDWLMKAHKRARIVLVGHSMGGLVGWWVAERRPGDVALLLTLAAPHSPHPLFPAADFHRRLAHHLSVPVVAINGGSRDWLMPEQHTWPPDSPRVLAISSRQVPGVWVEADHLCLLWCSQLVTRLGAALATADWAGGNETVLLPHWRAALETGPVPPQYARVGSFALLGVLAYRLRFGPVSPEAPGVTIVPRACPHLAVHRRHRHGGSVVRVHLPCGWALTMADVFASAPVDFDVQIDLLGSARKLAALLLPWLLLGVPVTAWLMLAPLDATAFPLAAFLALLLQALEHILVLSNLAPPQKKR
jgi:pimeloyl-ACP methyl ester carboxylesterase